MVKLCQGEGSREANQGCWMVAVQMYQQGEWNDHPDCVPEDLRAMCITVNDKLSSDDQREEVIGPMLFDPIGCKKDLESIQVRTALMFQGSLREYAKELPYTDMLKNHDKLVAASEHHLKEHPMYTPPFIQASGDHMHLLTNWPQHPWLQSYSLDTSLDSMLREIWRRLDEDVMRFIQALRDMSALYWSKINQEAGREIWRQSQSQSEVGLKHWIAQPRVWNADVHYSPNEASSHLTRTGLMDCARQSLMSLWNRGGHTKVVARLKEGMERTHTVPRELDEKRVAQAMQKMETWGCEV